MNLIICDSTQKRLEGVVLAAGKDRMRVALRGVSDVTELRREYGQWELETGEPVDLELLVGDSRFEMRRFLEEVYPRFYTA
ncbi:MAG TPA: hypothetical protein VG096_25175 [Bryobacteraceae bacterium]|jgi:hypothetical protein|nr:hypothetical protein [Bryobacteraceae bacterium]